MYPKNITEKILDLQAKGYSAELTRQWFIDNNNVKINVDTIYRHRKGTVSQEIAEETVKQQQQDITIAGQQNNRELAMKYRNELLKLLIPQMTINLSKSINENKTEINVTSDLLKQYESLFEEAALLEHCTPQPLHTTQTNTKTSTLSTTGQ